MEFKTTILIILDIIIFDKVKYDNKNFYKRLKQYIGNISLKEYKLTKHILQRQKDLYVTKDGKLIILKIWKDLKCLKLLEYINKGSFRKVY